VTVTGRDVMQCFDTDSYSAERQSIVFHHVRTVFLSGNIRLDDPDVMVGCRHGAEPRLFVLNGNDNMPGLNCVIYRIDPQTGFSDHGWLVDPATEIFSVAPAVNQLIVAMPDRIELYDTDGRMTRAIATPPIPGQTLLEASLMTDSMF